MSEHAQALMLSTKVHAAFGEVLMLAGVARIIEVCFIAPSYEKDAPSSDSDRNSDRTFALSGPSSLENPRLAVVQAFRHLPPFVSAYYDPHITIVTYRLLASHCSWVRVTLAIFTCL